MNNSEIKRFEVGRTYGTCSICDSNYLIYGKVIRRTEQTVTMEFPKGLPTGESVKTFRINKKKAEHFGEESVRPWGSYSMAPVLSAREVAA